MYQIDGRNSEAPQNRFEHEVTVKGAAYLQGDQRATWLELFEFLGLQLSHEDIVSLDEACDDRFNQITDLMRARMFGEVFAFPEKEVMEYFEKEISRTLDADPTRAVVILDKAVYWTMKERLKEKYGDRIQYLSITRSANSLFTSSSSGKVPRVGDPCFEVQIQNMAEALKDKNVSVVDDTLVEGGTSSAARAKLEEGGIMLTPKEEDLFYFRAVRKPNEPWDDAQAKVLALKSLASAEAREFSSTGGAHDGAGKANQVGFQVGPTAPFDPTAKALRLANRLDATAISDDILKMEIEHIQEIEGILKRPLTLLDLRRTIPSDAKDKNGRRSLIADYMIQHYFDGVEPTNDNEFKHKFLTFLRNTKLTDYLTFAKSRLEHSNKPEKDIVCTDMDGVLASLNRTDTDKAKVGFKGSKLEASVKQGAIRLLTSLHSGSVDSEISAEEVAEAEKELASINTEIGLVGYLTQKYGQEMVELYGKEAENRVREIFQSVYPEEDADTESTKFLSKMPTAYHVFRHLTWDHNLEEIYDQNPEHKGAAKDFAVNIVERGGRLTFITAAPKIHALKLLKDRGITDELKPEEYDLYTVEDMYDSKSVEDGRYVEGNKGTILRQISQKTGVPTEKISMGGDQYKSDVAAPIASGVQACLIPGPEHLARYAEYIRLPNDVRESESRFKSPGQIIDNGPAANDDQIISGVQADLRAFIS